MVEVQTEEKRHKKHIRPVFRRILLVLIGLILGLNVYFANARGIVGNQLPMPFGYGMANVLSGSMEPTFSKGALLIVKKSDAIQKGDIVVYQSESELIVHRVISIDGDQVQTQGDANNVADPVFDKTQIKGVVILWIPGLGNVVEMLRTPTGIILILLLAFLLVEGSFRKQRNADDQELDAIKAEIRRLKAENEDKSQEAQKDAGGQTKRK